MKEEKKRWVMPKFLPLKYDVKLINEDKVCLLCFLHWWCLKACFRAIMYPRSWFCHLTMIFVPFVSVYVLAQFMTKANQQLIRLTI